ncbi:hypothetical protein HOLleu_14998 [Holothuria leucospilota]|uniref:Uncharacterized protein n=1 Tax=Holothuria leucospilota TaxID=206669 RepID=A0A9Q1C8F8_HOLLE|nr:hypothetical protein HOLleu_14998 [Holothuria leucospilota]
MPSGLRALIWLGEEEFGDLLPLFEGNLCAGIFLGHILKYRCSSKNSQSVAASQAGAIKFSIQTVPISTDVAQAAKKKDTRYKQPFLLGLGPEKKADKFVWISTGNYHCH